MPKTENPLVGVKALGQSIWIDFIQRSMMASGALQRLISDDDICGLTSNPSIFEKAIAETDEYDAALEELIAEDRHTSGYDLYTALAVQDIAAAADIFSPVHQASRGDDGMVSLEVSPSLADDVEGTIKEAISLHERLNRPNVMIKVPGTKAGVEAFRRLTAMGISVNVTLLFSVSRYQDIAQAYVNGLAERHAAGQPLAGISSVASFFISRVDTAVDKVLADKGTDAANALMGKIAVANAKLAYAYYDELFNGEAFAALKAAGALPQRLLWASTSTKNPDYSDVYYIEELLGPDTVNTVPPATLDAYRDHGQPESRLGQGVPTAQRQVDALNSLGVDLDAVTDQLEKEGVEQFVQAFDRLLAALAVKRRALT